MYDEFDSRSEANQDEPSKEQEELNRSKGYRNLYTTIAVTCLAAIVLVITNNIDTEQYQPPKVPGVRGTQPVDILDRGLNAVTDTADRASRVVLETIDEATDRNDRDMSNFR